MPKSRITTYISRKTPRVSLAKIIKYMTMRIAEHICKIVRLGSAIFRFSPVRNNIYKIMFILTAVANHPKKASLVTKPAI